MINSLPCCVAGWGLHSLQGPLDLLTLLNQANVCSAHCRSLAAPPPPSLRTTPPAHAQCMHACTLTPHLPLACARAAGAAVTSGRWPSSLATCTWSPASHCWRQSAAAAATAPPRPLATLGAARRCCCPEVEGGGAGRPLAGGRQGTRPPAGRPAWALAADCRLCCGASPGPSVGPACDRGVRFGWGVWRWGRGRGCWCGAAGRGDGPGGSCLQRGRRLLPFARLRGSNQKGALLVVITSMIMAWHLKAG